MTRFTIRLGYIAVVIGTIIMVGCSGGESQQDPGTATASSDGPSGGAQAGGPPPPPPAAGTTGQSQNEVTPSSSRDVTVSGADTTQNMRTQGGRNPSADAQSIRNLKQIVLGLHNYHDVHKGFPAGCSATREGTPLLSWRVHILPYLNELDLYKQFQLDEPWDSPHNKSLIEKMPDVYRSPDGKAGPGMTTYLGNASANGIFGMPAEARLGNTKGPVGTRMRDIVDGTSNTLLVVEASDALAVAWTQPHDFVPKADDPLYGLGKGGGSFVAVFCDGAARTFAAEDTAADFSETVKSLLSRHGSEAIDLN